MDKTISELTTDEIIYTIIGAKFRKDNLLKAIQHFSQEHQQFYIGEILDMETIIELTTQEYFLRHQN